jgi:putative RNA 2'-phosphotransferase
MTIAIRHSDLSRTISHAFRHEPWLYELELDDAGWAPVEALLAALRVEKPAWAGLSETDLERMIERSEKKRHELHDGKIRALYGHSTAQKLLKKPARPPVRLFHGTSPESARRIREEGLKPMGRQYVHLSADAITAEQVGRRRAHEPVVLTIRSDEAYGAGTPFYQGNDLVWLADAITPEFIE